MSTPGAAFVFVRDGTAWVEQQRLAPSLGLDGEGFGSALAVLGDTAVIGSPFRSESAPGSWEGGAYVFTRSGTVWTERQFLLGSDTGVYGRSGPSRSRTRRT